MPESASAAEITHEPTVEGEIVDVRDSLGDSAEVQAFLDDVLGNDTLLGEMNQAAQRISNISTSQLRQMSEQDFTAQAFGEGSLDEKLALAELQGTLAKHGLTPINTVEGLVKLREALVVAYKDNAVVPAETRLRVNQLELDISVLEAKQQLVVQTEQIRAEQVLDQSKLDKAIAELKAVNTLQVANLEEQVRLLGAQVSTRDAVADGKIRDVEIQAKIKTAEIDHKLLIRQKRVEYLKKMYTTASELRVTIFRGAARPILRTLTIILFPLVLFSNLIADGPGREETAVFGFVNDTWDAFYTPVRDGVIRVYEQFAD